MSFDPTDPPSITDPPEERRSPEALEKAARDASPPDAAYLLRAAIRRRLAHPKDPVEAIVEYIEELSINLVHIIPRHEALALLGAADYDTLKMEHSVMADLIRERDCEIERLKHPQDEEHAPTKFRIMEGRPPE